MFDLLRQSHKYLIFAKEQFSEVYVEDCALTSLYTSTRFMLNALLKVEKDQKPYERDLVALYKALKVEHWGVGCMMRLENHLHDMSAWSPENIMTVGKLEVEAGKVEVVIGILFDCYTHAFNYINTHSNSNKDGDVAVQTKRPVTLESRMRTMLGGGLVGELMTITLIDHMPSDALAYNDEALRATIVKEYSKLHGKDV